MTTTTETTGRRAWMLLDFDLQGRQFRVTDSPTPLEVTDRSGRVFTYQPGLGSLNLTRRADAQAGNIQVVINIAQEPGWAHLVARGHYIDRAPARLLRWYEGQILDVADVWIRGRAMNPTYGNTTEPLTFTVMRLRRESGVIPTDDMLISAQTWPVTAGFIVDPSALGSWYPMIFGAPAAATTPAYLIEFDATDLPNSKVMIAGTPVGATTVTLHDPKGDQSVTRTVQEMADGLGRTISYVDFSGTFAPELDREYTIAWDQGGGGYVQDGVTLKGAGEITKSLFQSWTDIDLDEGRFASAESTLNAYELAFAIVGQVSVWDYVSGEILDLLPMEWTESVNGEYPLLWRFDATRADVTGSLIDCTRVTGRYVREGPIQSTGNIINRHTLQYGVGGEQQKPQSVATIGSGLDLLGNEDLSDTRVTPDQNCANSERIYGRRPASTVVTEIIDDAATAGLILQQWALQTALPRRALRVSGDLSLDEHEVNAIVLVTATDLSITEELAWVRGKQINGDLVILDLLLLDNPLLLTRATT